MKKIIILTMVMLTLSANIAYGQTKGDPFQNIWKEIQNLNNLILNIQLTPGPVGVKGDNGDTGPQGSISTTTIVKNSVVSGINLQENDKITADVSCPAGTKLLSGGAQVKIHTTIPSFTSGTVKGTLTESYPVDDNTWRGVGMALSSFAYYVMTVTSHAVCAS